MQGKSPSRTPHAPEPRGLQRANYTVAPTILGLVERLVGGGDKTLLIRIGCLECADADAHRHPALRQFERGNGGAQTLRDHAGTVTCGSRQQHRKFLTAIAGKEIAGPIAFQCLRNFLQCRITRQMPERVVEAFEVVHVDQQQ